MVNVNMQRTKKSYTTWFYVLVRFLSFFSSSEFIYINFLILIVIDNSIQSGFSTISSLFLSSLFPRTLYATSLLFFCPKTAPVFCFLFFSYYVCIRVTFSTQLNRLRTVIFFSSFFSFRYVSYESRFICG